MFVCRKCGRCCQCFRYFPEGNEWRNMLDRGDGTCKYLDEASRLCRIYDYRPPICNNVLYYEEHLKDTITREEFDGMLNEYCELIRSGRV